MLVDYNSDKHTSHRHVFRVEVEGEGNSEDRNELLEQISSDEATTDSGNKNDDEHNA